ncbi:clostripain-related cysteine peptidase [Thiothrix nivea]|nr:clostripain-related cysteine peptidase [Thiothrix nivea]
MAEWTIMIFMNGDNDLERWAVMDFNEIAKVDFGSMVNVVVQFDRIGDYISTNPQWTGCLRFKMFKGIEPLPTFAVQNMGELNMGSGKVLGDFVQWSRQNYPAKHYMLDVWNHGQGWRLATDTGISVSGRYKYISSDSTQGDIMYNRELQDSLFNVLKGEKLDVIGFDACLMATIETGFAMRNIAHVMVASEEIEPLSGWRYNHWLQLLVDDPSMDAVALGKMLVDSYRNTSEHDEEFRATFAMTLSAIQLSKMNDLAFVVHDLSEEMIRHLKKDILNIQKARASCYKYAMGEADVHSIDLSKFCENLQNTTSFLIIKKKAKLVCKLIDLLIIDNYASKYLQGDFGSKGIAIYFPETHALFLQDKYSTGYLNGNPEYPVEFVDKFKWDDFLQSYYSVLEEV